MSTECPYCERELDHSEPREWHSMGPSDEIHVKCDGCGERIRITTDLCWEVSAPEDCDDE